MTLALRDQGVRAVLLDIEGTTTPISFVHDVLFSYAREHLRPFLRERAHKRDVSEAVDLLRAERGEGTEPAVANLAEITAFAEQLMARDSKSPGLKALQGLIWKEGYESGALHGIVYNDVPPALRAWRAAGLRIAIYSSGSVLAQRLLFGTTAFGDLTKEIDAYFDTGVGPKREASSYAVIAHRLGIEPEAIVFLSDVLPEVVAARKALCQAVLVIRPGEETTVPADGVTTIGSFDQIEI